MDHSQALLFSEAPRAVGITTPNSQGGDIRQYIINSPKEMNAVIDKVKGKRNLYASISTYKPVKEDGEFSGCAIGVDKVSFDFDSSAKADPDDYPSLTPDEKPSWAHNLIPDNATDSDVMQSMLDKEDIREGVLSDVCHDVRELSKKSMELDIPFVGVFSGFGIHIHQLYQPIYSRPDDRLSSISRKFVAELKLSTVDEVATGKPYRIMRMPNVPRICHDDHESPFFVVPLLPHELLEVTPDSLIEKCSSVRTELFADLDLPDRPEMTIQEDYLGPRYADGVGQEKMRDIPDTSDAEQFAEDMIRRLTKMPCVYERATGRNPPNDVRVKVGIMLLNAGLSPVKATNIISNLHWIDFDRETTMYQLKQLRRSGKGDFSCKTMRGKGLCTRADNPKECKMFGYQGGNSPQ